MVAGRKGRAIRVSAKARVPFTPPLLFQVGVVEGMMPDRGRGGYLNEQCHVRYYILQQLRKTRLAKKLAVARFLWSPNSSTSGMLPMDQSKHSLDGHKRSHKFVGQRKV